MGIPNEKKESTKKGKRFVPTLDYVEIVDSLQDEAVAFCVEKLYSLCDYKVLKPKDVRRIDLEEWLLGLYEPTTPSLLSSKGNMERYLQTLENYVAHYAVYPSDAKADMYKKRFSCAIRAALSKSGTLNDIDDAVILFLNLLRPLQVNETDAVSGLPDELLGLRFEDADLLKNLWKYPQKPFDPLNNGFLDAIKQPNISDKDRRLAYVNNILFLARGLQQFGAFDKG